VGPLFFHPPITPDRNNPMNVPSFTEFLIVMIGFGVVGAYLAVVRHFLNSSEDKDASASLGSNHH